MLQKYGFLHIKNSIFVQQLPQKLILICLYTAGTNKKEAFPMVFHKCEKQVVSTVSTEKVLPSYVKNGLIWNFVTSLCFSY